MTNLTHQKEGEVIKRSEPVTRGEFLDFKDEMNEFKQAVFELFETQRRDFERYVGALGESLGSEIRMLAEGLKMQIESSDRKWEEQKVENSHFNRRIFKLESKQNRV